MLWFYAVYKTITSMFPPLCQDVVHCKQFRKYHISRRTKNQKKRLKKEIEKGNSGALVVAIIWALLFVTGSVFHVGEMWGEAILILVVIYIAVFDIICLYLWCPFKHLLETRCCNTCRISQWAAIMTLLPLAYINSFWTYSLVILSLASFVQFEYFHWKFPERFYEVTNKNLVCDHCPEEFCRMNEDKYPFLKEKSILRADGRKYE
jgi:hypothetical protein